VRRRLGHPLPCRALLSLLVLSVALWATLLGAAAQGSAATPPGYALVTQAGAVATFGGAGFQGDLNTESDPTGASPVVGLAVTPSRRGYWLVTRSGAVEAFGDAQAGPAVTPRAAIVGIAADPAGPGYWLLDQRGHLYSVHAPTLPSPVLSSSSQAVGLAVATGGRGVWIATAQRRVLAVGRTPGLVAPNLRAAEGPVTAITATADGNGYWVLTARGHIGTAGDAALYGRTQPDVSPAVALAPTPDGQGYLLLHRDGTAEFFGDATSEGNLSSPLHPPYYPKFYEYPPIEAVAAAYLPPGPVRSSSGPLRITFLGDSLSVLAAKYTQEYLAAQGSPDQVTIGGIEGCGVAGDLPTATPSQAQPAPTLPACGMWRQQYSQVVKTSHPDVVAVLLGYWETQRHELNGHTVDLVDSPAYRDDIVDQLAWLVSMIHEAGARVVLMTAPYYGDGTPSADVDAFNSLLHFVAAVDHVTLFDLGALIDPGGTYASTIFGITARTSDDVHLTQAGVEEIIDPFLVPRLDVLAVSTRFGAHDG
jgi:hypothetical protein